MGSHGSLLEKSCSFKGHGSLSAAPSRCWEAMRGACSRIIPPCGGRPDAGQFFCNFLKCVACTQEQRKKQRVANTGFKNNELPILDFRYCAPSSIPFFCNSERTLHLTPSTSLDDF